MCQQSVKHCMIHVPAVCWTLYDSCANSLLNTVWFMCQQSVEHCMIHVPAVCWTLYDSCANSLLNTAWSLKQTISYFCVVSCVFFLRRAFYSSQTLCFCFMRVSFLTTGYCKAFLKLFFIVLIIVYCTLKYCIALVIVYLFKSTVLHVFLFIVFKSTARFC